MSEDKDLKKIRNLLILKWIVSGVIIAFIIWFIWNTNIWGDSCCMCGSTRSNPFENQCCPCPNDEYAKEIIEFTGYEPDCGFTWSVMCEEYKEAFNKTFPCFK